MIKLNIKEPKNKKIIILIFLLISLSIIFLYVHKNYIKYNTKENITTKLNNDADFLEWFIDFDKLYKQNVKSPKYSLTEKSFQEIYNLLNNEEIKDIYYKNSVYYLSNNITLELDVNTRSFRYTKYKDNSKIEILEVRLINGKYYVQLVNSKNLYKITFNNKKVRNKKYRNKEKEVIINESIFNNKEFKW
ncbi:MAG: hypothetical protein MR765_07520 [Tenericutes bacterium]|nr:hypothetical protein [Mycoplasmatota bacterium]